jgi:hypothetical protein
MIKIEALIELIDGWSANKNYLPATAIKDELRRLGKVEIELKELQEQIKDSIEEKKYV